MRTLARYIGRCLFSDSLLPYLLFSPLFLLYITQTSCAFFSYLVPHQVSNHLPFASISLTSLSSTPLDNEIQLSFIPQNLIFILLDVLACPKINIKIYLFICLTHAARGTKTCITVVGPWRVKGGGDDLFLSPNHFHLS